MAAYELASLAVSLGTSMYLALRAASVCAKRLSCRFVTQLIVTAISLAPERRDPNSYAPSIRDPVRIAGYGLLECAPRRGHHSHNAARQGLDGSVL